MDNDFAAGYASAIQDLQQYLLHAAECIEQAKDEQMADIARTYTPRDDAYLAQASALLYTPITLLNLAEVLDDDAVVTWIKEYGTRMREEQQDD